MKKNEILKTEDKTVRIEGTKESPAIKIFDITDCKVTKENDVVVMRGYANTKNKEDRYGDIPAIYEGHRNYVYELSEFLKNPVMLLDHSNQVSSIAGSFTEIVEDELGLRFTAVFSNSTLPEIEHARTVYLEGHGKALSIAGRWHFEDKDNPNKLTYAEIYHISPVGVGADPNALGFTSIEKPPKKDIDKAAAFKYCICKECGYSEDKVAGDPCQEIMCPKCKTPLMGSNEKPKKSIEEPKIKYTNTDTGDIYNEVDGKLVKVGNIADNKPKENELEQKAKDLLSEMKEFLKEKEMNTEIKKTMQEFKEMLAK